MSKLLSQATRGWAADMKARGYETVDGSEARTGRAGYSPGNMPDFGSTVLRSARMMKNDVSEEEAMKKAMMEKAKASMK